MSKRITVPFFIVAITALLGLILIDVSESQILPARTIDIASPHTAPVVASQNVASASWTLSQKIEEARTMLQGMDLFVGSKSITYYENRLTTDSSGRIVTSRKKMSEEAKEIALALLNTETGAIQIVVIKRQGDVLIMPQGYSIEVVTRPSGIRWNYWNTHYRITEPKNLIVIGNRYPQLDTKTVTERVRNKQGKMVSVKREVRSIEYVYYVPYSDDLHREELIAEGRAYIKGVVQEARKRLAENNVKSRSVPGKLVTDVTALQPEFFERLPLLEQSDLGEFVLNPHKTAERVFVLIASNQEGAFGKTCNGSSACGWVQFIPSTYKDIDKKYPAAGLIDDTMLGRADHVNSMMAAILLHDNNLKGLVDRYGDKIMSDTRLEEYLAASYNGSPNWVYKSINAVAGKNVTDWTKHLRKETLGFMVKLRFIRANILI